MITILQKEHPTLRGQATEVPSSEIVSQKIKKILRDMRAALNSREDGIAIAAPQIGAPLRIFIISSRAFEIEDALPKKIKIIKATGTQTPKEDHRVFINPEIIKSSKEKVWLEEGCLSVNQVYGRARRSKKISVRAKDENGKIFSMTGNTLLSQIFQHEIDHLNGILFSDHAKDLHTLSEAPNAK